MRLKYRYDQLPTKSDKFNSHSIQDMIFFAKLDQFFSQKNKERTAVLLVSKKIITKKSSKLRSDRLKLQIKSHPNRCHYPLILV